MKAIGIEKARRRLAEAEQHSERMASLDGSADKDEFERSWFWLLTAINSVPEILMTSSRSNPRSRQWFDKIRNQEIRRDPLLQFLAQARGTDFHGLESGAALQADIVGQVPDWPDHLPFKVLSATVLAKDGKRHVLPTKGPYLLAGPFEWRLAAVTDHHGNVFNPPARHLNQDLPDTSPLAVARLAIAYYSALLEMAASHTD